MSHVSRIKEQRICLISERTVIICAIYVKERRIAGFTMRLERHGMTYVLIRNVMRDSGIMGLVTYETSKGKRCNA